MTDKIVAGILFLVGVVNLLPVVVFFDASQTARLYGVPIEDASLTILMRHRGVLLAIVGIALIAAVFKSEYRTLAVGLALVSKIAFVFLTFSASGYSAEVRQVALIDVAAIVLLLTALALNFYDR